MKIVRKISWPTFYEFGTHGSKIVNTMAVKKTAKTSANTAPHKMFVSALARLKDDAQKIIATIGASNSNGLLFNIHCVASGYSPLNKVGGYVRAVIVTTNQSPRHVMANALVMITRVARCISYLQNGLLSTGPLRHSTSGLALPRVSPLVDSTCGRP